MSSSRISDVIPISSTIGCGNMQPDHHGLTQVSNAEMPTADAQASRADNSCCQSTRPTCNPHYAVGNPQIQHNPPACSKGCVAANRSLDLEVDAAVALIKDLACSEGVSQETSQRSEILRRLQLLDRKSLALQLRMKEEDARSQEIRARMAKRDRLMKRMRALTCDMEVARRETWIARQQLKAVQRKHRNGLSESRSVL